MSLREPTPAHAIDVLLDTGIGTNVDDTACLAYLLAEPACNLLGITTVTGDAPRYDAFHARRSRRPHGS